LNSSDKVDKLNSSDKVDKLDKLDGNSAGFGCPSNNTSPTRG
jgi:hypothetical protein